MEISYCFRWSGTGNIAEISYVSAVPDPEIIEEIILGLGESLPEKMRKFPMFPVFRYRKFCRK